MKTKLFTLLMLTSLFTFSQKLKINEKDEMSGDIVKRTTSVYIQTGMANSTSVYMEKINSKTYLHIPYEKSAKNWIGVENTFSVVKDQLVIIKLANDSVVKLSIKDNITATKGGSGKVISGCPGINITCEITDENIQKLLSSVAVKIRIYMVDPKNDKGYFEFDINKETVFKDLINLVQ